MNFLQDGLTASTVGPITNSWTALQRAYGCKCNSAVFFLNSHCLRCDTPLGYEPEIGQVLSLVPSAVFGTWGVLGHPGLYRRCANLNRPAACNWLVREDEIGQEYCIACRLNRTIPDLSSPLDALLWGRIEAAKRRVISALVALGLPVRSRVTEDRENGLAFDFLRSPNGGPRVLTGHEDGLITLNIEEADDVTREQMRTSMHEPYRTLVGHFRHEVGHYYWDRLVAGTHWHQRFRDLFGDESSNYAAALKANYESGPKPGWPLRHVSAYASVHPWEDWAETWAHYMHMVDTLSTATSFDLRPESMSLPFECFGPEALYWRDTEGAESFLTLVNSWLKMAAVMNELCRSMGQPDFYPFALSTIAVTKLHFVHLVVCSTSRRCSDSQASTIGQRTTFDWRPRINCGSGKPELATRN